jgi:hypothetical protein
MTREPTIRKGVSCKKHGLVEHYWHKDARYITKGQWRCIECRRESDYKYHGGRPMSENRKCPSWLGIHVAERVLSKFFDHVERMPYGNKGYDFICGKGKRIDVKSACLCQSGLHFDIHRNILADYFLCLGFTDRESLEPIHVWLIPGEKINHLKSLGISNGQKSLARWSQYERPLDRVIACCNEMKGVV